MKKLLAVLCVVLSLLILTSCFGGSTNKTSTPPTVTSTEKSSETAPPVETTIPIIETTESPVETEELSVETSSVEITTEPPTEPITETETEPELETEPIPVMTEDSTFEIYFLDVGQGDAACVICDGRAMMVDGGNKSESSLIYSFLRSHDIEHLDYIIASHPDADHVGGLAGALNYATVGAAYCTVTDYDSEPFQNFVKYLGRRDCEITVPSAGDSFYLGCAKVTILYPDPDETRSDNTSIALRIEYGDTSFFFTGDCETDDEAAILQSDFDLKSDVLKVAHHGSKYSTTKAFVNAVRPAFAVISVAGNNTYGHPTDDVLSRLHDKGVILYRTDIQGDVHCMSDGTTVTFEVEKNADFDTYLAAGGYQNYLDELAAQETEPEPDDRTLPGEDDSEETEPTVTYIANTNTKKFHYPSCSSVGQMKESNKWYFTGTRDELIDLGYDPCGRCHP